MLPPKLRQRSAETAVQCNDFQLSSFDCNAPFLGAPFFLPPAALAAPALADLLGIELLARSCCSSHDAEAKIPAVRAPSGPNCAARSSTSLPLARPRPRIPPRSLRRPAFSKIHHSPSSPFVSSTVVVCMSSSDSLWLLLEILDDTTDFVEVSVVHL